MREPMKRQLTSKAGVERRPIGSKLKAIDGSWVVAAVAMVRMLGTGSNEGDALDFFEFLDLVSRTTIEEKCPSFQQPI